MFFLSLPLLAIPEKKKKKKTFRPEWWLGECREVRGDEVRDICVREGEGACNCLGSKTVALIELNKLLPEVSFFFFFFFGSGAEKRRKGVSWP